jgi:hypothetical protein
LFSKEIFDVDREILEFGKPLRPIFPKILDSPFGCLKNVPWLDEGEALYWQGGAKA